MTLSSITNQFESPQHQRPRRSTSIAQHLPRVVRHLREGSEDGRKKPAHGLPATRFLLLPHRRSKTARPGSPHPAPQPSAVPQELPGSTPTEPVSSSPHPPSIQHPAPSRRRKQPVRGDLRFFREAGTIKLCTLQFKHSNTYE